MNLRNIVFVVFTTLILGCSNVDSPILPMPQTIEQSSLTKLDINIAGTLTQKLNFSLNNPNSYAKLSVYHGERLLVDKFIITKSKDHNFSVLVTFPDFGETSISLQSFGADMRLNSFSNQAVAALDIPVYSDITEQAGIDQVASLKYGGPTVADIDADGDYDFIVNNHNAETSKLYWNNGDGTVSKHEKNLGRWFMHDLHGTSAADYDNDGDLDIIVTQGGGNGNNPSKANFYLNDKNRLVRYTGDVGIHKGGRGRGARWLDMDQDGDLDLMLVNEASLSKEKPQHFFYENIGEGKLSLKSVDGIQDEHASRALISDLNNDQIDDIILFGPMSVWLGNGDFTFTDISEQFPKSANVDGINAIADLDIDNDGDLDLYLATSKSNRIMASKGPIVDFDPILKQFAIQTNGLKGVDEFTFEADGPLVFSHYLHSTRATYRGKTYPFFLGNNKQTLYPKVGDEFSITPEMATGLPKERNENGAYVAYLGEGKWHISLVRNNALFWNFQFQLQGPTQVQTLFEPSHRASQDILLRNDNGVFVDVSNAWNLPSASASRGVTTGDFNNDGFSDLFVYRQGDISQRVSDYMLLNNGAGSFETLTMHGANDSGGPGYGDMGQAFDFDLDGDIDLLNGSEHGYWYLYENTLAGKGNHLLVRVGYSEKENIDPLGAIVSVTSANGTVTARVGSAGEIFSQSLLNIVHVGLGNASTATDVTVTWRNGESKRFVNQAANQLIATSAVTQRAEWNTADLAIKPYIKIVNQEQLQNTPLSTANPLTVEIEYHAGSDQQVIWADEGGVRIWLRHFKNEWVPIKDVVHVQSEALYTESGVAKHTFTLKDYLPSSELPEGQFYMLRATFTASDGNMYDTGIYPLNIVAPGQ